MMIEVKYINTCVDYYKIPDDLDLLDETVVEEYWVKYRTLYIKYVGKEKVEEYKATYQDEGTDFKRPDEVDIVDADDTFVDYTEEDASEDEYEEEWCEEHEQVMWKNGLKCGACLEEEEQKNEPDSYDYNPRVEIRFDYKAIAEMNAEATKE